MVEMYVATHPNDDDKNKKGVTRMQLSMMKNEELTVSSPNLLSSLEYQLHRPS